MAYVEEAVYPKEMGLIDDEHVKRAERVQTNKRRLKWQPIAVAACLLIVIGAYMGISNMDKGSNSKSDNMLFQLCTMETKYTKHLGTTLKKEIVTEILNMLVCIHIMSQLKWQ